MIKADEVIQFTNCIILRYAHKWAKVKKRLQYKSFHATVAG